MDGEVTVANAAQVGEAVGADEAQASTEDRRAEETMGRAVPAQAKASSMGALFTEVTSAVQGVVKASGLEANPEGDCSSGTWVSWDRGNGWMSDLGYVTAVSEGDGPATGEFGQGCPLTVPGDSECSSRVAAFGEFGFWRDYSVGSQKAASAVYECTGRFGA